MDRSSGIVRSLLIVATPETTGMYIEYCAWRGIEARGVASAWDAMRELAVTLPDAVVVAERLDDASGHDLVRAIRCSRRTFNLAIVMLASNTFAVNLHDTSKQGCDLVLTVPVLPDELIDGVNALLQRRAPRRFDAWLLRRGSESVWMVRTARLELTVSGPRERRGAFHFDAERDLLAFQADYQQRLQRTGFALEALGGDRRSGVERRRLRRDGSDRRGIH